MRSYPSKITWIVCLLLVTQVRNAAEPSYIEYDSRFQDIKNNYSKSSAGDEFAMYLAAKYSPSAKYILHKLKTINAPQVIKNKKIPDYWFESGKDQKGTLKSMQVIVHEGNHMVTDFVMDPKTYTHIRRDKNGQVILQGSQRYYTANGINILVPHTPTFESRKIRSYLPKYITQESDKKKISGPGGNYYEVYIYPSNLNPSTQAFGIYGLLDEFNAYYQGKRATYDMYGYFKESLPFGTLEKNYIEYLKTMYSNYLAYYEFKIFILTYLIYAKEHEKSVYEGIVNNKAFVDAFLRIDALHKKLKEDFDKRESEIINDLKSKGIEVSWPQEHKELMKIGNEFVLHDLTNKAKYLKTLAGPKYKNMEKTLRQIIQ